MSNSTENKQVVVQENSLLLDSKSFDHAQRVSKMLAASTMVPEHFRNNVGNCVIALNYASRAGIDPFMAMQKMYIIKGKPAVETQLQIALFNKSDRYSALKFKLSGQGDGKKCVAYATDKDIGEIVEGPEVSIKMAKDEGWYSKSGSKWKTLLDLMLRYRSAAFFIRLYAPETTLGLHTAEEMADTGNVIDVTPDQQLEQEIEANANTEDIDFESTGEPVADVEADEEQGSEIPDDSMTDEEKAEIEAEERAQAEAEQQQEGPGF